MIVVTFLSCQMHIYTRSRAQLAWLSFNCFLHISIHRSRFHLCPILTPSWRLRPLFLPDNFCFRQHFSQSWLLIHWQILIDVIHSNRSRIGPCCRLYSDTFQLLYRTIPGKTSKQVGTTWRWRNTTCAESCSIHSHFGTGICLCACCLLVQRTSAVFMSFFIFSFGVLL